MNKEFLPINLAEMTARGWTQADFVLISGDAYVDHSSFGPAIISRVLEAHGYKVAIIAQPDWRKPESILACGKPRLAYLVTSGNMDSMVNHYTVAKRHRRLDAYTAGGEMGKRPDYAVVVYGNLIRQSDKKTPIILGGIEASLRRMAHYDYWSDKVKRSVLLDAAADMLLYGMAEKAVVEVADALNAGLAISDLTYLPGTVVKVSNPNDFPEAIHLPSYEEIKTDKYTFAKSFLWQYQNTDPFFAKALLEPYPNKCYVLQNPPTKPCNQLELDDIYALPYTGMVHPAEAAKGKVAAIEEMRYSITANRGCFGACSFCAITFHQGRIVQGRSLSSILAEAKEMTKQADFKGIINDVGGPTANFMHPSCSKQTQHGTCKHKDCLWPKPCPKLEVDHRDYLKILRSLRDLPKVKKVFIRSGIRYDYLNLDPDPSFMKELCAYHVSGQLRIAPEHCSDAVLNLMGKPSIKEYHRFAKRFVKESERLGKCQYVLPYLMSSHPGASIKEAIEVAEFVRDLGYIPEQVQDFYPTPSTLSTCMFYTGLDPRTMKPIYVARSAKEKALQRALLQYRDPKNHSLVLQALRIAGREDLIGFDKRCLIPPRLIGQKASFQNKSSGKGKGKIEKRRKSR